MQGADEGDTTTIIETAIAAAEQVEAAQADVEEPQPDLDSRAELAAELLASLDGPADPDAEVAWNIEIERRVAAIEAGTVNSSSLGTT